MLSYCLKSRKNTGSKNLSVRAKNGKYCFYRNVLCDIEIY